MIELSPALRDLYDSWMPLTVEQKAAVLQVIKAMNQK